jgi:DNA-binding response OmpR family regulator
LSVSAVWLCSSWCQRFRTTSSGITSVTNVRGRSSSSCRTNACTGYTLEQSHYLRIYVRQLRQKLGDSVADPIYVATERGMGYRWIHGE